MAAEQEGFRQLLTSLLSTDNDVRTQGEEAYGRLPVESKVTHLLAAMCDVGSGGGGTPAVDEDGRQMAAVLLRRVFASDFQELYGKLGPEQQGALKEQLAGALQREQSDGMRRKTCDAVAEAARNLIDDDGNNQWPEMLQLMFQCVNSGDARLKESALRIFTAVPGIFGNQESNYLELIKQMLQQSLVSTDGPEVRFQAVKAAGAFALLHDKEPQVLRHLGELLAPLVRGVAESVERQEDDGLLKTLIELAEGVPKFLRPQLAPIFEMCMKVYGSSDADDGWRHMALEVMVTLSETAPAMVRKTADKYVVALVPLVLTMMTDIDDDEAWGTRDEIAEEDSDANNVVAESALDRLACGLGGKLVLPLVVHNVPAMLASPEWQQRHAALMAISAVGEGCHRQMEDILDNVMDGVLQYLRDPHPRVRYAACNAIGQMSTDFAPAFEKRFHERVVPGLLMALDDEANPRVQAHAGAALVNFSEDCPKQILAQYLDAVMAKLEAVLVAKFKELVENGTKLVLEQIVTTIASVADTAEKDFVVYYDRLMPCLKYIVENANTEELRMLRGKTIECVSLIGLAVGPGKFLDDAGQIMDLLLKSQTGELADDDPQTSYLISAWSRICKVMGKRFEQYLPLVMGPVLRTAAMKPEVALLDNDDLQSVEDDVDWQFVSLGEQQNFGIRTAGLEEKANACVMLVCYARELKEGFANYAEEVVRLMVPMLKFYFHDTVRTAAAESLPYLLDCAKIKGPQYLQGMWNYVCPELLKAIDTEPEPEVAVELMRSLSQCIETLGAGCLGPEPMTELLRILDRTMKEHFERANDRLGKHLDEDYDETAEEQLEDEENEDLYLLSRVADVLHALFAAYGASFVPYFDQICGHFAALLAPDRPWPDRQWGLCVFDDAIEFAGPACAKYRELFVRHMAAYLRDKSPEVRQAAAYGWGVLAQHGGDYFAEDCAAALPALGELVSAPDSRSPKNVNPTENAISAVAKILKHRGCHDDGLLLAWLGWLPVTEDEDEAPHVYGYLCDLIEANHPVVLGPDNANLPRLVGVLAEAFARSVVEPDAPVGARMLAILRQVRSNETAFRTCAAALTQEQQQALAQALQSEP